MTWHELTVTDITDEVIEVVHMVIDGWYTDEKIDVYQFLDQVESHLFAGFDNSVRLCLPSDLDHEVNKRLLSLGRKYKKSLGV